MLTSDIQVHIISKLLLLETLVRIAMSSLFGFALIGFGLALIFSSKAYNGFELCHKISRSLSIFGALCIVIYGTLEFILPVSTHITQAYIMMAFILSIASHLIDKKARPIPALSFAISAVIFCLVTLTPFIDPKPIIIIKHYDWLIYLHIVLASTGEAVFIIACSASFIYIHRYKKLKNKILNKTIYTASLASLEKLLERSLFVGLSFITLSLLTGIALSFVSQINNKRESLKIIWAFLVWMWYVITILGRNYWGWRGRKGARLVVIGTLLLILGLFGTLWKFL